MHNIVLLTKMGFIASLNSDSMKSNTNILTKYKAKIVVPSLLLFYIVLFFFIGSIMFIDADSTVMDYRSIGLIKFAYIFAMALYISLVMAQSTLFEFRDKEFLLSLPVKEWEIVASKLLVGMTYTLVPYMAMMLGCAYTINHSYMLYALASILNVFPVFCLGSFLAIFFRKLVDKRKHAKRLRTALQSVFVIFLMMTNNVMSKGFIVNLATVNEYVPFVVLPYEVVSSFNVLSGILLVALNIVFVALFKKFIVKQILSFEDEGTQWKADAYVSQKQVAVKNNSLSKTLLKYNFKQLFDIPGYFITVSMGLIYTVIICVGLCIYVSFFRQGSMAEFLDGDPIEFVAAVVLFALYAAGCSCGLCAISISIEGKGFYVFKTAPLDARDIITPKILVNFIVIIVSTMICWTTLTFTYGIDVLFYLMGALLLILVALRVSLVGMVMGIHFPKMNMDRAKTLHSIATIGTPIINLLIVYGMYQLGNKILLPLGVSMSGLVGIGIGIEFVLCTIGIWYLNKRSSVLLNRIIV